MNKQNFAQKLDFSYLRHWDQKNLTFSSTKYKQAATVLAMKFYQQVPCIICRNEHKVVAHHIIRRGKCTHLVAAPENIIPLCFAHHMGNGNPCAHPASRDTEMAHDFWNLLLERMPDRMSALELMKGNVGKHDYRQDMYNWQAYWNEGRDYEFICELLKIEPWL